MAADWLCERFLKAEALRGGFDSLCPKLRGQPLGALSLGVPLTASQVTLPSGQVTLLSESISLRGKFVPLLGDLLKAQEDDLGRDPSLLPLFIGPALPLGAAKRDHRIRSDADLGLPLDGVPKQVPGNEIRRGGRNRPSPTPL